MKTSNKLTLKLFLILGVSGTLALTACDTTDDDNELTLAEKQEVAESVGQDLAENNDGEYEAIQDAIDPLYESVEVNKKLGKVSTDTVITRGNLTIRLYRKFANTTGDSTHTYQSGNSYALKVNRSIKGNLTGVQRYHEYDMEHEFEITGLDGEATAYELNGSGSKDNYHQFTSLFRNATAYHTIVSDGNFSDVTFNKADDDRIPDSGTRTYSVKVERYRANDRGQVERRFEATVRIVFDGTTTPPIYVEGDRVGTVNLNTGTVSTGSEIGEN